MSTSAHACEIQVFTGKVPLADFDYPRLHALAADKGVVLPPGVSDHTPYSMLVRLGVGLLGVRPAVPWDLDERMKALMARMWRPVPSERPDALAVLTELKSMLAGVERRFFVCVMCVCACVWCICCMCCGVCVCVCVCVCACVCVCVCVCACVCVSVCVCTCVWQGRGFNDNVIFAHVYFCCFVACGGGAA